MFNGTTQLDTFCRNWELLRSMLQMTHRASNHASCVRSLNRRLMKHFWGFCLQASSSFATLAQEQSVIVAVSIKLLSSPIATRLSSLAGYVISSWRFSDCTNNVLQQQVLYCNNNDRNCGNDWGWCWSCPNVIFLVIDLVHKCSITNQSLGWL